MQSDDAALNLDTNWFGEDELHDGTRSADGDAGGTTPETERILRLRQASRALHRVLGDD